MYFVLDPTHDNHPVPFESYAVAERYATNCGGEIVGEGQVSGIFHTPLESEDDDDL